MAQERKNPYQFSIAATTQAALNTPVTTTVTPTGFDGNVTAFVKNNGATIRKNGTGSYGSSVVIQPGDTIDLQVTTPNANAILYPAYGGNGIDVWICAGQSNMNGFPANQTGAPSPAMGYVLGYDSPAARLLSYTVTLTGSITGGNLLTVTGTPSGGVLAIGQVIYNGATAVGTIVSFGTGTGGAGSYNLYSGATNTGSTSLVSYGSNSAVFTGVISGTNLLTVSSAPTSGAIAVGQNIFSFSGTTLLGTISGFGTGTGGAGTYNLTAGAVNTSSTSMMSIGTSSETLANPISATYGYGSNGSSLPQFGYTMSNLNNRPLCFIQTAIGSTNLVASGVSSSDNGCWDPAYTGGAVATPIIPNGMCFNYACSFVNAGLVKLASLGSGYTPILRGILWCQGEDDGGSSISTSAYQTTLASLISQFRTAFNDPTLPFFIYRTGAFTGVQATSQTTVTYNGITFSGIFPSDTAFQAIRQAQENAALADNVYIIYRGAVNYLPLPSNLNLSPPQVGPTGSSAVSSPTYCLDLMRDSITDTSTQVHQATFNGSLATSTGILTVTGSVSGTITGGSAGALGYLAAVYYSSGLLGYIEAYGTSGTSGTGGTGTYQLTAFPASPVNPSGAMCSGPLLGQLHYNQTGYNDMGYAGAHAINDLGYAASNWTTTSLVVNLTIGTVSASWLVNTIGRAIGAKAANGVGANAYLVAQTGQSLSQYVQQTAINYSDQTVTYYALATNSSGGISSDGGSTWHYGGGDPVSIVSGGTLTVRCMSSASHTTQTFLSIGVQLDSVNYFVTTS